MKRLGLLFLGILWAVVGCGRNEAVTSTDAFLNDPFIPYVTGLNEMILTALYPREWHTFGSASGAILSSSQAFIDSGATDDLGDGAAIVIETTSTNLLGSDNPTQILTDLLQQQTGLERVTAVSPMMVDEWPAATANAHRIVGEADYLVIFTFITVQDQVILLLSTAPNAQQAEIATVNETFVDSIEIFTPATINYLEDEVVYGQKVQAMALPGGITGVFFNGQANEVVNVMVEPLDDDLALEVSILGGEGAPITATIFGGVTSMEGVTLPETSPYFVAVRGRDGTSGEFELRIELDE